MKMKACAVIEVQTISLQGCDYAQIYPPINNLHKTIYILAETLIHLTIGLTRYPSLVVLQVCS